jgi:hypothetical protein
MGEELADIGERSEVDTSGMVRGWGNRRDQSGRLRNNMIISRSR